MPLQSLPMPPKVKVVINTCFYILLWTFNSRQNESDKTCILLAHVVIVCFPEYVQNRFISSKSYSSDHEMKIISEISTSPMRTRLNAY